MQSMRAGLSFPYPPISLLLGQPLSIKKSYAGAIQLAFSERQSRTYEKIQKQNKAKTFGPKIFCTDRKSFVRSKILLNKRIY
jgi:hypothetical protein